MQFSKIKTKISQLFGEEMWEVITGMTVILSIASVLLWVGTLNPGVAHASAIEANSFKVDTFNSFVETSLLTSHYDFSCENSYDQEFQKLLLVQSDIDWLTTQITRIDENLYQLNQDTKLQNFGYLNQAEAVANSSKVYLMAVQEELISINEDVKDMIDDCSETIKKSKTYDISDVLISDGSVEQALRNFENSERELFESKRGFKDIVYLELG